MRATPLPSRLAGRPFRTARALKLGVTRGRLGARDLAAPFRGVRAPAGAEALIDLCRAYAQRMPRGHVFSHTTAARLWGLPLPDEIPLPLHVSAPAPKRQPRMRGVVGHPLGTGIRVARARGLPVVAAADAWCQLATVLSHDDLVAAGDRIVGWPKPLAGLDAVDAAIERFGSRRGAIRLRAARADLRPGSASRRETRLRLRVLRAGFPEPELNTPSRSMRTGRRTATSSSGSTSCCSSTTASSTARTTLSSTATSNGSTTSLLPDGSSSASGDGCPCRAPSTSSNARCEPGAGKALGRRDVELPLALARRASNPAEPAPRQRQAGVRGIP